MHLLLSVPTFQFVFFYRGGGGGGQARGDDLIDMASPVVVVLTFIYMYMPASGWRCLIVDYRVVNKLITCQQ